MSTEQKLDLLISEVAELKALLYHGNLLPAKAAKTKKPKETPEETANRLLAKINGVANARKGRSV